jgi:LysM repeat protein
MRLSEFIVEATPMSPIAAAARPAAAANPTQAQVDQANAVQTHVGAAAEKFGQGNNTGGVMSTLKAANSAANAAGASFLDKIEMGWMAIKAGASAAIAGRKGDANAAINAAVGSMGGEIADLSASYVNQPDFAQNFQTAMLAMKDSTDPDQQEMYKKYMSRQLTAESFKAYMLRFNAAIQDMKKNPATAKPNMDDTPYVTPEELPTGPNANPMSRDPSQRAATTETAELNRILKLSGMEFIAEDSAKSITVQRGDTLGRIAADNSTTVDAIVKLNNISNPDRIFPGDVIKIPGGQGDPGGRKKRQGPSDDAAKPNADRASTSNATGNAKIAMDFFTSQGWTPEQAAGLVANLQAESYDRLDPAALGDKGRGYGIAQWHGPRQQKFEEIIGVPLKGSSLEDQLKFVQWELTNSKSAERQAGNRLKSATTAAEAAAVIDEFYERSSGIHRQRRIAKANALLPTTA